jgi:hypothetical protein
VNAIMAMVDVVTNLIGHLIQAELTPADYLCAIVLKGAGDAQSDIF